MKKINLILCKDEQIHEFFNYFIKHENDLFILSNLLILFESSADYKWPFQARPSQIIIPDFPSHITASIPFFEDKHIPSRIASPCQEKPGCYFGRAEELIKNLHYKINYIHFLNYVDPAPALDSDSDLSL